MGKLDLGILRYSDGLECQMTVSQGFERLDDETKVRAAYYRWNRDNTLTTAFKAAGSQWYCKWPRSEQ